MGNQNYKKVILITGCATGIGKATAFCFARAGYSVYASCRTLNGLPDLEKVSANSDIDLTAIGLDVTDQRSVAQAIEQIIREKGHIDAVVNNAGIVIAGTVEMVTIDDLSKIIDVNLLGAVRILHEVLPLMRAQKSGHIINISSGAGVVGLPGFDAYVASKFALEGLSESLWYELRPYCINVSIIEPGPVSTNFLDKMAYGSRLSGENNSYADFIDNVLSAYQREFGEYFQSPEEIAVVILKAFEDKNPKLRYQTSIMMKHEVGQIRKNSTDYGHLVKFGKMIDL